MTERVFPLDNSQSRMEVWCIEPRLFELRLEISPIPEDVEDAIVDSFDGLIATHSGATTLTLSAGGDTCVGAVESAIEKLRDLGVIPIRLIDDLVGRREIARRAGVTPQAVGLWIRGERHATSLFPPPFVDAAGGLWLWGEVVTALADRGVLVDGDVQYPSRLDSQRIGGILAARQTAGSAGRM
jgi:hypothetical protein